MNLLLLDDEFHVRKKLMQKIDWKTLGIDRLLEAGDGEQGYELAVNEPIDIIISDIRMPEMRGDGFLEWIKSNQLFKHIPVIMLSSEDSTTERIRLLQEGAEDYIVKPFNPMELKVRIKKIIE